MRYMPEISQRDIMANHEIVESRLAIYRTAGLDFRQNRRFILEKAGLFEEPILDIGSGRGINAVALASEGYEFDTIDNNEEMLKITAMNLAYLRLLRKARLHKMNAYALNFGDESFNTVFTVEALHHMDDAGRLFSGMDRVLRPGGRMIVSDFNRAGMEILDEFHRSEGHRHFVSSVGRTETVDYLGRYGYSVREYDDACHWLVIAEKITLPK